MIDTRSIARQRWLAPNVVELCGVDGDGPVLRYICHIGHVLTGEAMLVAQADPIEHQATGLLAMLNEQRELCRQLIDAEEGDQEYLEQLRGRTTRRAETVRNFLNWSLVD